jgi:hypothetical protein
LWALRRHLAGRRRPGHVPRAWLVCGRFSAGWGVTGMGRHSAPELPVPREPLDDAWEWSWDGEPGDVGTIVVARLPKAVCRAQQRYAARRRLDEQAGR